MSSSRENMWTLQLTKRYVVKQRPLTMYAVDNRYYSDKGEEYSDKITREHPRPRTMEWRETIFVNDKPFSANLTRLQCAISRP